MVKSAAILSLAVAILVAPRLTAQNAPSASVPRPIACESLLDLPNVTVIRAVSRPATAAAPAHCYIQGTIDSRIRFHMQLPLPENWNGRLLNIGDGGKDGVLNFADIAWPRGTRWRTPIPVTTPPPNRARRSHKMTSTP